MGFLSTRDSRDSRDQERESKRRNIRRKVSFVFREEKESRRIITPSSFRDYIFFFATLLTSLSLSLADCLLFQFHNLVSLLFKSTFLLLSRHFQVIDLYFGFMTSFSTHIFANEYGKRNK